MHRLYSLEFRIGALPLSPVDIARSYGDNWSDQYVISRIYHKINGPDLLDNPSKPATAPRGGETSESLWLIETPMRQPRLTIRTMMALIAAAAVLLAAEKARRRWVLCRDEAHDCAESAASYLRVAAVAEARRRYEKFQAEGDLPSAARNRQRWERWTGEAEHGREMAVRFARRRAQYERAMFRPWESIPPESP